MGDNVNITAGVGTAIATDDIGNVHFQKIKVDVGGDGASIPIVGGEQLSAASLPVVIASDQSELNVYIKDPTTGKQVSVEANGGLAVNIQDQHSETVDLYLYRLDASPTLTSSIAVDDVIFDIDTNADISNGDVITIYEGTYFYQALVTSSTVITVTVSTPCDKVFTVAATVEVGPWNMAVDGTTPQTFKIHPPAGLDFDIYGLTISGLSASSMDATTFLGIAGGITNGLLLRQVNAITKNLGLIVNNLGFEEFGYTVTYTTANKFSEYGVVMHKNISATNGVSLRLGGTTSDEIQAIIRDNLSVESLLAIIVKGHVVTD